MKDNVTNSALVVAEEGRRGSGLNHMSAVKREYIENHYRRVL